MLDAEKVAHGGSTPDYPNGQRASAVGLWDLDEISWPFHQFLQFSQSTNTPFTGNISSLHRDPELLRRLRLPSGSWSAFPGVLPTSGPRDRPASVYAALHPLATRLHQHFQGHHGR